MNFHTTTPHCAACNRRLCAFLDAGDQLRRPKTLSLARGDRLEALDGACLRVWIILDGTAGICTTFEDGRRQIVGLESRGDAVCGLMSSVEAGLWLEALEDCLICELDFSGAAQRLRADPDFIASMFAVAHDRLEAVTRHVATLGRLDSTERVILFLAEMARRAGHSDTPALVALPMSREDIADYLGLNTETVSRIMSRIKKSGLVKFLSPTEYMVPDFGAIERRLPVPVPVRRPSVTQNLSPADHHREMTP